MKFFTPEIFIQLQVAGKKQYRHNILLSNGWELRLQFRDVNIFEADGLLPSAHEIQQSTVMQSA